MTNTSRRFDMDWLRIFAFMLLILYHIGMFYVTWDWHVKSPRASAAIEPLMLLVNPWRLSLLMLISGIACGFMLDKMPPLRFGLSRFHRLFWPLVFAMFVIVPPQSYFELYDAARLGQIEAYSESYATFWLKYISGYDGWCDAHGCLNVPTWNHMWFVAYLLFYCLVLALIWPVVNRLRTLRLPVWLFLIVPVLVMCGFRVLLQPVFGDTHALIDDWYLHSLYIFLFVLGALIARSDSVFEVCRRFKWVSAGVGLGAYAVVLAMVRGWIPFSWSPLELAAYNMVRELQAWMMICALIGFAHQYLQYSDGPVRRDLTEAVFPFYIIHQTATIIAAYGLAKYNLPIWIEFALVLFATVVACVAAWQLGRIVPVLRPVLGMGNKPNPS